MKNISQTFLASIFIIAVFYPTSVYANSSWHWVTYSPKTILPYAVLLTLLIEIAGIIKIGKIDELKRTITVVAAANIVSFIFPYIERAIRFRVVAGNLIYALDKAFDSGPYYLIMVGYMVLTLVLEMPLVYYFLREHSRNKRHLLYAIILSNVITTIVVFFVERLLSHGKW